MNDGRTINDPAPPAPATAATVPAKRTQAAPQATGPREADPPILLRTERLGKTYLDGDVQALRNVNLSVRQGEFVAIMGPSGCGKSTMLNLLGALDRPTEGEVYFAGQPLSAHRNLDCFRAEKVGFVFQSFYLLPTLTALENVQIPMFESRRTPAERRQRAAAILEAVGLGHRLEHSTLKLSGGERQRVAIARALANQPSLLLADEPTGNLDSATSREVLDLFARLHREQGLTILLITHDPQVAARAERVIAMRDGGIVADSRNSPREHATAETAAAPPEPAAAGSAGAEAAS